MLIFGLVPFCLLCPSRELLATRTLLGETDGSRAARDVHRAAFSCQRCVDACDPGATTGKPTLTCELSAKPTLTSQDAAPSLPTREAAVTLQAARAA